MTVCKEEGCEAPLSPSSGSLNCSHCKSLKTRYGLTKVDRDKIYDKQNGECAICTYPIKFYQANTGEKHIGHRRACIDHDHETSKVREILCHNCNIALGLINDDIEVLKKMIKYLEEHKNDK